MNDDPCTFDPKTVHGPIGMFHCPECGEMQMAGMEHLSPWSEEDDISYQKYMKDNEEKG